MRQWTRQTPLRSVTLAAALSIAVSVTAAERTMHHDDPVIQQALLIVGQQLNAVSVVGLPAIREIYARAGAGPPPAGLNGFRATGDASDTPIYINRDSDLYRNAARKPTAINLLKLAATLVHEQVHNTDGEFAARRLQADFVRSKLNTLPRSQQEDARRYLQGLDARAAVLGRQHLHEQQR